MTAATDRLEQAIAGLKDRFLRGLPARLDVIAGALQTSAVSDVERGFHSLAGTASTYGLLGIAAVAAEGEYLCANGLDDDVLPRVTALLTRLRLITGSWQRPQSVPEGSSEQGSVCTS